MATFTVKVWCGLNMITDLNLTVIPRVGETMRMSEVEFYLVEEVIWIYDEPIPNRVNLLVKQYTPKEW